MNKLSTIILSSLLSLAGISANAQTFHPCDTDHDGVVNVTDLAVAASYILTGEYQPAQLPSSECGAKTQAFHPCDANHDGVVDVTDLAVVANYILTGEYQQAEQLYNGYEYVDLGLPSGLKWATCNVGADAPEDNGGYFAWGEFESKDNYDWGTYMWYNSSKKSITKYNNSAFSDKKTVLDLEDDAANVNWGGEWRMPTRIELDELIVNCTWTWTTVNGVNGYIVTSNINGNSIFLPASGYFYGSEFADEGLRSFYWSSSLNSSSPTSSTNSFCLSISSSAAKRSDYNRYYGFSVRPVFCLVDSIALSACAATLDVDETLKLTATVTPSHAIQTVTWTSSNPSVATVSKSGTVTAVSPGNTVITATTASGMTATCKVNVVASYNGHGYVDLGLPSGLKWATCNVGANVPEDFGDYFAWGETEPKNTRYDWSTYKWCNGTSRSMTKYCTGAYYGTVDNKTVLEPEDDAAHVNWGGDWRMPTQTEFDELLNNCTIGWTTQNGVNGYGVTSNINGNSIFLPAAGNFRDNSVLAGYGYYWSSSLDTSASDWAYFYFFSSTVGEWSNWCRYFGESVRAVCQLP